MQKSLKCNMADGLKSLLAWWMGLLFIPLWMVADHNHFYSLTATEKIISFVLGCQDEHVCSEDEGVQIRQSYWSIINSQQSQANVL